MVYLDYAATTPVEEAVIARIADSLKNQYGNPSAQYPYGQDSKKIIEADRRAIAAILGCDEKELFFTSCGTESDNWAISLALHKNRHVGKHIITTSVEHSAIIETCKALQKQGYEVTYLKPDKDGNISASQVENALREDTALISVMLVNNELGTVFPLNEIHEIIKKHNSKALLHADAVQGFLKVLSNPKDLGVDLMSISAHKIGGPKGIGALYISSSLRTVEPLIYGGGQESGLRSGTEAVSQIAGFATACVIRSENLQEKLSHMAKIKAYCLDRLLSIEGITRIGNGEAPHILCVSLPGYPSANIITDLGSQGICISAGSACHRGKLSHVVQALDLDKRTASGVIRISFGPSTTEDEIDILYNALLQHKSTRFPML